MNNLLLVLKGFFIGIANVIPGVSGGTIALILGIYEKLVDSISNLFKDLKRNILFLLPIGIGIILSIIVFSRVIEYSYSTFPFPEQIEGVYDLMTELKERGIKICIVTGSGQNSVLNRICKDFEGLIHKDLMVTSHDVQHGKPQPDPYLMGIQKVGASAEECIVVENAPMGIKAGKAAGCYTVAVNTGPLPNSILEDAGADVVFKTMKELQNNLPSLLTVEKNKINI